MVEVDFRFKQENIFRVIELLKNIYEVFYGHQINKKLVVEKNLNSLLTAFYSEKLEKQA